MLHKNTPMSRESERRGKENWCLCYQIC